MAKKKPAKVDNNVIETLTGQMGWQSMYGAQQLSKADTMWESTRSYLITNLPILLSQMYSENGLVETLIDVPVEDALRGGFDLASQQIDEVQLTDLIQRIETLDLEEIKYSLKWARLYGGGGLLTMTDGNKDKRFDFKEVKKGGRVQFKAADIWELNTNCIRPDETFQLGGDIKDEHRVREDAQRYTYYNNSVHSSRVLRVVGKRAPSNIRARLRGWGLSEVESFVRSINQYLKTNNLTFEVLDEFKIDVFKFQGLANLLQNSKGMEVANRRISMANMAKNYQSGIALDGNDDYQQKQVSFTGIGEVMREIKMQVAADLRMPLTKLFGQSAAGFNSGEDDIENYNAMIESRIRPQAKVILKHVINVRCMQMFGFIPTDLKLSLKPLRIMSAEQEETIKTQKFNRLATARAQGEIDTKEFREAVNKDNLLSIPLDINKEMVPNPELEEEEETP